LIEQFQYWDDQYGIELSDIEYDAVAVTFKEVPEDLIELVLEI
jgi:hypothetical protein